MNKSARVLADEFDISDQEMYMVFRDQGFVEGKPGDWSLTDKGKQFAALNFEYTANGKPIIVWDEQVLDHMVLNDETFEAAKNAVTDARKAHFEEQVKKEEAYDREMLQREKAKVDVANREKAFAFGTAVVAGVGFGGAYLYEHWYEIKNQLWLFWDRFFRRR